MTAAYRMKGLGWFAGVVIVAIGLYLVSLQVAAERKKVELVDRAIAQAQRDLRMLDTEFNTRANLAQLERWNGDVLALSAPRADQFMGDAQQLAQIDFNSPGGHDATVRLAAYVVPALHPMPGLDLEPASTPGGAPRPAAILAVATAASAAVAIALPVAVPAASVTKSRPAAMASPSVTHAASIALLDRKLLSDSTMSDLVVRARDEASLR